MTATFDPTLPTALDRVRRAVGDTDIIAALRTDEEIAAVLVLNSGDETGAIASVAAGLAVEFAQRPDRISDEGTSISWGERVKTWLAIAENARGSLVVTTTGDGGSEKLVRWDVEIDHAEYDPNRVDWSW